MIFDYFVFAEGAHSVTKVREFVLWGNILVKIVINVQNLDQIANFSAFLVFFCRNCALILHYQLIKEVI